MRIFLTGATGYIGSALAAALRNAGHDVGAIVRPDADSGPLRGLGVGVISGDLESLPSLREQLESYDAYIHTAQSRTNPVAADRAAIDTFTALPGHFIFTSGVWVMGNGASDERSPVNPIELVKWRPPHEELVLGGGGAVIRPGCVYGGKQSLLANWFAAAEQNRPLQIVGNGKNRWSMIDLRELTGLYLRAIELKATGILHAIDDTDARLEECARAVAPEGTIETIPLDAARANLGAFADALAIDQKVSSALTREATGWMPSRTFTASISEQWEEWRQTRAAVR